MNKPKMIIYRHGIRYHGTKKRLPDGRTKFSFWSSHKWPFYHASYTPDVVSVSDVWRKFYDFIPEPDGG